MIRELSDKFHYFCWSIVDTIKTNLFNFFIKICFYALLLFLILFSILMAYYGVATVLGLFEEGTAVNEIGDFMAGWFAPLAFAWFVFAVILQSFELRATRKQLHAQTAEYTRVADFENLKHSLNILEELEKNAHTRVINEIYVELKDVISSFIKEEEHEGNGVLAVLQINIFSMENERFIKKAFEYDKLNNDEIFKMVDQDQLSKALNSLKSEFIYVNAIDDSDLALNNYLSAKLESNKLLYKLFTLYRLEKYRTERIWQKHFNG